MASPKMNMGRVVRSGENAVFTFQLPGTGLAGQLGHDAWRLDSTNTHPVVNSSVQELAGTPGTYMLTVNSADMAADGVYYAAISHQDVVIRIPAWTYDPSDEFDTIIGGISGLDAKLQSETDAIDATLTALDAKLQSETDAIDTAVGNLSNDVTTLTNLVQTETNAIDTDISNLQGYIQTETDAIDAQLDLMHNEWDDLIPGANPTPAGRLKALLDSTFAAVGDLDTKVQTETNAIDGAITALDAKVQSETDALDTAVGNLAAQVTSDTNAIDAAITALDAKVQSETDALDTAVSNLAAQVTSDTNAIDGAITALDAKVQAETDAIDAAITALDAKVQSETDQIDHEIGNFQSLTNTNAGGWSLSDALGASQFDAAGMSMHDWLDSKFTGTVQEINDNETKIDNLAAQVTSDTNAIDGAITALDAKVQAETDALDTAVSNLAAQVTSDTNAIDTEVAAARTDIGNLAAFVQTETNAIDAAITALDAKVQSETDALDTAVSNLAAQVTADTDAIDTAVGLVQTRVDLLQTDGDAVTRYNSLDTSISAVRAVLDESLVVNSKIIPAVPSEFLSPMSEQILRIACNVVGPVSGSTSAGALEDPDNNECGVRGYSVDGSNGSVAEFNYATSLFETNAKLTALPVASGAGIAIAYRLMKRTSVGQFEAYFVIPANQHGMLQWDFMIQDSDPSGSPQAFNTVRYTVLRRMAQFNSYGAF